jgi:hypothetical protein
VGSVAIDNTIMIANSNSVGLIRPPAAAALGSVYTIFHMIYVDSRSRLRLLRGYAADNEDDRIWSSSLYYRSELRATRCYGVVVPGAVVLGGVAGTAVGWAGAAG